MAETTKDYGVQILLQIWTRRKVRAIITISQTGFLFMAMFFFSYNSQNVSVDTISIFQIPIYLQNTAALKIVYTTNLYTTLTPLK